MRLGSMHQSAFMASKFIGMLDITLLTMNIYQLIHEKYGLPAIIEMYVEGRR